MGAPTIGQTVQYYPKRGGMLVDLNAIEAIVPLNARVCNIGPTLKVQLMVSPTDGRKPFLVKNIPYFDSEFATRPYTNIIPGDGGYCVDPEDAPPFPPLKTVPYQQAGWNMPLSPTHPTANPEDSAQPYVPVKIMEDDTGNTPTEVAQDPQ